MKQTKPKVIMSSDQNQYRGLSILSRLRHSAYCWLFLLAINPALATTIVLDIADGTNEGFNDPSVVTPVGGNKATTLGEQRRLVFEFAANIIASIIDSPATIRVRAAFDPLTCTSTMGTLGQAGPGGWSRNTCGVLIGSTWHPHALLNAQNGANPACNGFFDTWPDEDLFPSTPDIQTIFNSTINNNPGCLAGRSFYYGLDGNPGIDFELLTTVLHEIIHGLGFATLVNLNTGGTSGNFNDVYMLNLEDDSLNDTWGSPTFTAQERVNSATDDGDLHWVGAAVSAEASSLNNGVTGGQVQMFAPNTLQPGSSVSHFDTDLAPNELMEPINTGPKSTIGLAEQLLEDIGWSIFADHQPVLSGIADQQLSSFDTGTVSFAVFDNDTSVNQLSFSLSSSNSAVVSSSGLALSGNGRLRTLSIAPVPGSVGLTTLTVSASDGQNTVQQQFDVSVFSDANPVISVQQPANGALLFAAPQQLQATAIDQEDGDLSASIVWQSSLDGSLGSGANLAVSLQDGEHTLVLTVTDSANNTSSEIVAVTVDLNGDEDGDGLSNSIEVLLGTDPLREDSDFDQLSDFDEVNRDGDPLNFTPGVDSDPLSNDTDGDGSIDGLDPDPLDPTIVAPVNVTIPLWALAMIGLFIGVIVSLGRLQRH